MCITDHLVSRAEAHVRQKLQHLPSDYTYHCPDHTLEVVDAVRIIGPEEGLGSDALNKVLIAAWFHDLGYKDSQEAHEEHSKAAVRHFLHQEGIATATAEEVAALIDVTRQDAEPRNQLERVLKDADFFHLATSKAPDRGEQIRQEIAQTCGKTFSDDEWLAQNLQFLQDHQYYTDYGKQVLAAGKRRNIEALKQKLHATSSMNQDTANGT